MSINLRKSVMFWMSYDGKWIAALNPSDNMSQTTRLVAESSLLDAIRHWAGNVP